MTLTMERPTKKERRARKSFEARGSRGAKRPPLRDLPPSLRDLKRGRALTDDQAIDALRWLQDVIDDAAAAAGVE